MVSSPAIRTQDLSLHYGSTIGLDGLSLEVERGEVFGLLGPNGAGKTTAIRILLNLIRPQRGNAYLLGISAADPAARSHVGYLPGDLFLDPRMTGSQLLRFLGNLRTSESASAEEPCRLLGLSGRDLERRIREYSRGMKQKLGLAIAFRNRPELLVLDEPTSALDPMTREVVFHLMQEARDRGAAIFQSSHVLSEVDRTCDRVGVLRNGRLVALMTIAEARAVASREMAVVFQREPSLAELREGGMELVRRARDRLILRVAGDLPLALRTLGSYSILHMEFPEPRLEEAFQDLYQGGRTHFVPHSDSDGQGERGAPGEEEP